MTLSYQVKLIIAFVVAAFSGSRLINSAFGLDINSVWSYIGLFFWLIVFGVSASLAYYYFSRRRHRLLDDKHAAIIEEQTAKLNQQGGYHAKDD